ncbi:MAG: LysR family transcriptional regulator [Pyramidobacter sp.]|nr:LysR family transcriptional regulator [Pyramidobacter sp.]
MNVDTLRYIIAIAEEKSVSKAAERLFISQSSLSRTLQKIEQTLGESLFYRTPAGMVPTPGGEFFLKSAHQILGLVSGINTEFCAFNSGHKGTLTLAAPIRMCNILFPDSLKAFNAKYPNVEIRIHDISGKGTEEEVLSGKADLGFVYLPAQCGNVEIVPLLNIPSVVVMAKTHADNKHAYRSPQLGTMCIDLRNLKDSSFILPPPSTNSRRYMDREFEAAGFTPRVAIEVTNLDVIIGLVAAGLGITAIPYLKGLIYASVADRINLYTVKSASPPNTIAAIYPQNANLTTVARNYLNMLTSMFHTDR